VTGDLLDQDAAAFAAANVPRPPAPPPVDLRRRQSILHLLWTVPIATFISLYLLVIAVLARCGIYSCGWGGQTELPVVSFIICLAIGAIYALAIGGVRWTRSFAGSRTVAIFTGSVFSIITLAICFLGVR
jgi:hypothetical protein